MISAWDVAGAVVWSAGAALCAFGVRWGWRNEEPLSLIYGTMAMMGMLAGAVWSLARLCGAHA